MVRALAFIALLLSTCVAQASTLEWRKLPSTGLSGSGCLLGVSHEAVLLLDAVGEGAVSIRLLHPLTDRSAVWRDVGRLANPRIGAAAVNDSSGMLVVGGKDRTGTLTHVSRIEWDPMRSQIRETSLPALPRPIASPVAAVVNGQLFVAGDGPGLWSLDLAAAGGRWVSIAPWPVVGFQPAAMAAQSAGDEPRLYAFGLDADERPRCLSYDLRRAVWEERASPPSLDLPTSAVSSGQAHVVLVSERGGLTYHTITDTWIDSTDFGPGIVGVTRVGNGLITISRTGEAAVGERPAVKSRLVWLDYVMLAGYPAFLLVMGLLVRVKSNDAEGYFRGGQQIPWWAAGLSLVATQVSAIGFMAIPAKSFATDWTYFMGVMTWFAIVPVVTCFYIPLFRRLNVTTAYEYLEVRFGYSMRVFASVMFMLIQVTRAAVVLYLPALALSAVTGVDKIWCILAMGAVSTVYTLLGGIQTVIWTDVVQAVTLLGGVILSLIIVLINVGGLDVLWQTAWADGKLDLVSPRQDLAGSALWVVLIGGFFARLAALTSDQNVVQRYQSTPSNRDASRALWTDAMISIPWAILIFTLGTALYVFYKHNPGLLDPSMDTDQIVPLFIAQRVPAGLAGLAIAAIFAASLDGSMLAVATVFVNDIYARLRPASTARSRVTWARVVTLALGGFSTFIGVLLATSNIASLWDQAMRLSGLFSGAFAGVFVLALFAPRVGSVAAFFGVAVSAITMYFVERSQSVSVLIYACFGVTSCVLAALAASSVFPSARPVHDVPSSAGSTGERRFAANVTASP